ncbi:MAG: copper homeostasis protein CutC [Spirochaetaceae bacterium]
MANYKIEVCVDSLTSCIESQRGGADRVELCDNMFEGGTTPSYGNIKQARKLLDIGLHVIIRPRGGDFNYSDYEFESMKDDITICKELGVDGVVFGILTKDGQIDIKRCAELVEISKPMQLTFHRAFDVAKDPYIALQEIIELGFHRVLTSGQEPSVMEGVDLISELVDIAEGNIIIMPGCGITVRNMPKVIEKTKAKEFHVLINCLEESQMEHRSDDIFMGSSVRNPEFQRGITDKQAISKLKK